MVRNTRWLMVTLIVVGCVSAVVLSATAGASTTEALTSDEAASMDDVIELADRIAGVMPDLASLDQYAGAELISENPPRFVVSYADAASVERAERILEVGGLPEAATRLVGKSEAELISMVEKAWEALEDPNLHATVSSIGVDPSTNGLAVVIDERARDSQADLDIVSLLRLVGPDIRIATTYGPMVEDASCSHRGDCIDPMRAGNRIEKGHMNGADCTMGFHVRKNQDAQFLTAGHCGATGANSWYHDGWGQVGTEKASSYGGIYSLDVMRVSLFDPQASDQIYRYSSQSYNIVGKRNNSELYSGLPICFSGEQSFIKCGEIELVYDSWNSSTCQCNTWGASSDMVAAGGDSGAPVYNNANHSALNRFAIGVLATQSGHFTRIENALNNLGVTLIT